MTAVDRMFARYRTVLGGSTLVMVGLSWPLWVDLPDFPRVPFFSTLPTLPPWVAWFILAGFVISLTLTTLGLIWRSAMALSLTLLTASVVQDQNRLQPWAYQFLITGIGLVCLPRSRSLTLARWYTIALYAYSGLSKLDASFCNELGPTFLSAALAPFGLSASSWPQPVQVAGILAMAGFELVVAFLLALPGTRRVGLIGSIILHASLLMILGPWNLGHSTIVLVWNLAQVLENLCLFLPITIPTDPEPGTKLGPFGMIVFGFAIVLPLGERWGFADAWPAHALYASHAERSDIYLPEEEIDRFPEAIRRRLAPADATPWRRLDLTGWSRDVRGTPMYPSGRVGNAVAEFLEDRYGGIQPIRLVQWGRATVWDGRRESDQSLGLRAIRRRGDRFRINAHPSDR